MVLQSNQKHSGCWRDLTQSISTAEAQLNSVVRRTDLKSDQNRLKSFELLLFAQGIRLKNGSQIEPVA